MKKRKVKKTGVRLFYFGTLSVFVICYFLFNLCYYSYRIMVLKKTKTDLETQLVSLKNTEETLSNDIVKLKDPEYIAKFARENYMYSMDGEYIIKIENEKEIDVKQEEDFDYKYVIFLSSTCLLIVILYIIRKQKKQ